MITVISRILLTISYVISSISSLSSSNCNYLYVSPHSFAYNGWYQYSPINQKFGSNYFYSIDKPDTINILIYQNKWHFYNWNNKNESYVESAQTTANIDSLQVSTINDTNPVISNWHSMSDVSQITLTILCSIKIDSSIEAISSAKGVTSSQESMEPTPTQLQWLINHENCHDKSRGYVGVITTNQLSQSIAAYWDVPTLSNHTSNVTVSVSGNYNEYSIGQHQITYAAENSQYLIMCQITLYIIGNVSQTDMYKCTELSNERIGIIDFIVDKDTFLVIDPDKYEYQLLDIRNNPAQVLYVTPELMDRDVICYININWAKTGRKISHVSMSNTDNSQNSFVAWQVLIVLCIIGLFGLVCERIYFYRRVYNVKYHSIASDNDADMSLNMDEMDPIMHVPFSNKSGYEQSRSLSASAAGGSQTRFSPMLNTDLNMSRMNNRSSNRAMSMQISSYPFTRPPTKEEFFEQRRRKSASVTNNQSMQRRNQRYMSVPNNLMSENSLKKRTMNENEIKQTLWINEYEDSDFWKKELRILKEAGFVNQKKNLSMLVKFVVKNQEQIVDKRMTQSVVLRILQKEQKQKKLNEQSDEMENFLENEWENKNVNNNQSITPVMNEEIQQ